MLMEELDRALEATLPLAFDALVLPLGGRLAVLAPHPDDFDAIAVTLQRFARSEWDIHVAVLTTGASGVEDAYHGATTAQDKAALREAEQRASCAAFGLPSENLYFLRLDEDENGHQREGEINRLRLARFLATVGPHCVFMPHGEDSNTAHRRTWSMFEAIARDEGLQVWAWLNRDAKTLAMREDVYTLFGAEEAEWKARLLRLHDSQQSRNLRTRGAGFDTRVLEVNRAAAREAGLDGVLAEVFELRRVG
jgi:LmbE family N-acetylglucosaminyl deacetylase